RQLAQGHAFRRAVELRHQVEARQRDVEGVAQPPADLALDHLLAGEQAQPQPQLVLVVVRPLRDLGLGVERYRQIFSHSFSSITTPRPPPRASRAAGPAWLAWTGPLRCTFHMIRNTAGSVLMRGPLSTEPALFTRMAIGPRAASAAVTWRLTSPASVPSATPKPAAAPASTV